MSLLTDNIPALFSAFGTTVGSVVQAYPLMQKRTARVRDIENDVGALPSLIDWFYTWPQRIYVFILLVITAIGLILVASIALPEVSFFRTLPFYNFVNERPLVLLLFWCVVGAVMHLNVLSKLLVAVAKMATGLAMVRESLGASRFTALAGWPTLAELIKLNEQAAPVVVRPSNIDAFVDEILNLARNGALPRSRAQRPAMPADMPRDEYRTRAGNALLLGCLLEDAHYELKLPSRDWTPIYDGCSIVAFTTDLLMPKETAGGSSSVSIDVNNVLGQVDQRLAAEGLPLLGVHPALNQRIVDTFGHLDARFNGSAVRIVPSSRPWLRSQIEAAVAEVNKLPGLQGNGLRTQFVKLARTWGVWEEVKFKDFQLPFAANIAALLLNRRVLDAPASVKSLSFTSNEQRAAYSIAMRLIIESVHKIVSPNRTGHAQWLPTESVKADDDTFWWWLAYEIDFRIWSLSRTAGAGARWNTDNGIVKR